MATVFPWPWLYPYSPGAQFEIEPQGIYANATLRFAKFFTQYPASTYTLQYGLAPYAGTLSGPITFSSVPLNGSDWHLISVLPATTKTWTPGRYTWQCFAQLNSDATNRDYISTGTIIVNPDLTLPGAVDTRGKWQKILDEIDDMIIATAGDTAEEVQIGRGTIAGQSIRGWSRLDLINFRDYAAHMAGNEARVKAARGGAPNPRYKYAVMGNQGPSVALNFPSFQ